MSTPAAFEQPSQTASQRAFAAEERARLLIDSIRDYAVFMVSPAGVVESWNAGAAAINGYTAEEIIGKSITLFYPPEVGEDRWEREREIAAREGRFEEEGWRVRKDGSLYCANVILSAIRDESGALIGFSNVTRDLSERVQAERELRRTEERFRLMVESVKDYAIFMLDPDGYVQTWNEGARRAKGYEASEIVGKHISTFYAPEDVAAGKVEKLLRQAADEGRVEDEGWRYRKGRQPFWADVVITSIRDESGTLRGFVKVTRDLSERRMAEQERVRLAQANEAIRLRDEFLSIAAHELRTPLTALQLQIASVRQQARACSPELDSKLERISRSTERLTGLIDALLDVSRISTGRFSLHRERVNLSATVADAVDRMREAAERARCDLIPVVEPSLQANVDPLRMDQVIGNLLSNAIKYAAGMPVRICLSKQGKDAVLEVVDKGAGIPERDLGRIFERFERAVPIRHFGGLGLGLYVTRQIVEAHGGSVTACNNQDGGAVFTVRIPLES